jgi:hypothetical protein
MDLHEGLEVTSPRPSMPAPGTLLLITSVRSRQATDSVLANNGYCATPDCPHTSVYVQDAASSQLESASGRAKTHLSTISNKPQGQGYCISFQPVTIVCMQQVPLVDDICESQLALTTSFLSYYSRSSYGIHVHQYRGTSCGSARRVAGDRGLPTPSAR